MPAEALDQGAISRDAVARLVRSAKGGMGAQLIKQSERCLRCPKKEPIVTQHDVLPKIGYGEREPCEWATEKKAVSASVPECVPHALSRALHDDWTDSNQLPPFSLPTI